MIILIDSGNSRLKVGWLDASNPDMPREPAVVAFDGLDLDARPGSLVEMVLGVAAGKVSKSEVAVFLAAHVR